MKTFFFLFLYSIIAMPTIVAMHASKSLSNLVVLSDDAALQTDAMQSIPVEHLPIPMQVFEDVIKEYYQPAYEYPHYFQHLIDAAQNTYKELSGAERLNDSALMLIQVKHHLTRIAYRNGLFHVANALKSETNIQFPGLDIVWEFVSNVAFINNVHVGLLTVELSPKFSATAKAIFGDYFLQLGADSLLINQTKRYVLKHNHNFIKAMGDFVRNRNYSC